MICVCLCVYINSLVYVVKLNYQFYIFFKITFENKQGYDLSGPPDVGCLLCRPKVRLPGWANEWVILGYVEELGFTILK